MNFARKTPWVYQEDSDGFEALVRLCWPLAEDALKAHKAAGNYVPDERAWKRNWAACEAQKMMQRSGRAA